MKRLHDKNASWIWEVPGWPEFFWNDGRILSGLGQARRAQGQVLGAARLLDPRLSREALAKILVEEALETSAIEGEKLDLASLRSSVARRLGLPTAGLVATASRETDGLV